MKAPQFQALWVPGPVGPLEVLRLDSALDGPIQGVVLVAHPNPLQGGTFTNKVVQTVAKTFSRLGYVAYCPNVRGVGQSAGEHDHGRGEVADMAAVWAYAQAEHGHAQPLVLAGFSFGAFVQAQYQAERSAAGEPVAGLLLIGPAVSRWAFPAVPADTLVIHGEEDEVVALSDVLDWARPQHLPITVVPGTGHFFHGQLLVLQQWLSRRWSRG